MPPKIRELIAKLHEAGFHAYSGRGSHRNYVHPDSGRLGDDTKPYQIRAVQRAIEESKQ